MERSLRVLLIEGHERVRAALSDAFGRIQELTLVAVSSAASAIPLVSELEPDIVLYEPRADGSTSMLRHLVAAGRPVVVWTCSLTEGEGQVYLEACVAAVYLKSTNLDLLVTNLRHLVARRPSQARVHGVPVVEDDPAICEMVEMVLRARQEIA